MRKKFIILMPILAIIILLSFTFNVKASVGKIDVVYCNPAEDCSTAVRFNWHSTAEACVLHYTLEADTEFAYENRLTVAGVLNVAKYTTDDKFYVYKTQLDGLTPDTKYIYKITCGSYSTDVYKFKTAGFSGSFNFMNFGDVHSDASEPGKITNLNKLLGWAESKTDSIGGLDFIISTGDDVKYGNRYSDWQEYNRADVKNNYLLAPINGNHEQKTSAGQSAVHDWLLNTWNQPQNGVSEDQYSYWYIYNNVLFIGVDDQRGTTGSVSAKWAESVLQANEGKYQYCIVYKHNPWFRKSDSTYCEYGNYDDFRAIFDKYGVDLALSGDDHVYVHTKPLYNDTVSSDPLKGTIYITVPQIPVSTSALGVVRSTINNRYEWVEASGGAIGAMYFTVTPEKLCGYTYTWNGTVVDSFEIQAKRPFTAREDLKLKIEDSLEYVQIKDSNEGTVYGDSSMTSLVKKIDFYNGDALVASYNPSTAKISAFKLESLEANKLLNLTAKVTYVDNTESNVNFTANTFDYFGRISNFRAGISEGNMILSWHSELVGNSVKKIKLYRNDQLVGTVDANVQTCQFAKNDADKGATYRLELVSDNDVVIGEYKCVYLAMGDLNYDGTVDANDCDEITNCVFGGTLTNEQKALADIDKNGVIDFGDVAYMWLNHKKGISLASDDVIVTYKSIDGASISIQVIRSGTDASEPAGPALEGYTFVGWTVSNTSINENTTIYPIYSK